MGGFDKLMQALADRLREQQGRHQGGSKWIGTAGTSPFGAYGYNPEGVRIGQDEGRHGRAVKVWDRREFRDLDDDGRARHPRDQGGAAPPAPLGARGRRRRARPRRAPSAAPPSRAGSTSSPAPSGATRSRCCSSSTSAARWTATSAWSRSCSPPPAPSSGTSSTSTSTTASTRASGATTAAAGTRRPPTADLLRTYGPDWRVVFVGDAAMSPYEITHPGGANEHWNAETGETWLRRLRDAWPRSIWINPTPAGSTGATPPRSR